MEPRRLIGQPMYTDDHRRPYAGPLEQSAPLRNSLTVTGEDDRFGRARRNIYGDLPSTTVLERLTDKPSQECARGTRRSVRFTFRAVHSYSKAFAVTIRSSLSSVRPGLGSRESRYQPQPKPAYGGRSRTAPFEPCDNRSREKRGVLRDIARAWTSNGPRNGAAHKRCSQSGVPW